MKFQTQKGKFALITGASSGIGAEFAKIHASLGGDLLLVSRNNQALENLKTEILKTCPVHIEILSMDLSEPSSPEILFKETATRGINVDYLINNAGFGGQGYFWERPLETELKMIQLNISTLVALNHLYLKGMKERRSGKILNISSSAALVPGGPLQSIYFATKSFVLSFSLGLSEELRGTGITLTVLCPGPFQSGFSQRAGLEKTSLFSGVAYGSREVAEDGYKAMLKGILVQKSALSLFTRIQLSLVPLTPRRLVLKKLFDLQMLKK